MSLSALFKAVRAPFFTGVIVPTVLGAALAWHSGYAIHWGYFFLTLFGIIFIHAGANTINDYFDHRSQNDDLNENFVRPFSGGSRVIQQNGLSGKGMLIYSLTLYLIGIIVGLILAYTRGLPILWIGLIGVAIGVFYVMPGINLAGRGFGEAGIFVSFGTLCVVGSYYVQAQVLNPEPFFVSIPVGLLITAVLWINEFPDFEADKQVGKTHWVIRLGKRNASRVYFALMLVTYISIITLAAFYNIWLLLGALTLPISLKISLNAMKNYANTPALIPSNAGTIQAHLLTGLLLSCGYVVDKLV